MRRLKTSAARQKKRRPTRTRKTEAFCTRRTHMHARALLPSLYGRGVCVCGGGGGVEEMVCAGRRGSWRVWVGVSSELP